MHRLENEKLPDFFKPLLWSYDFNKIDPQKNKKTIIINSINLGDLRHWKWLISAYGKEEVRSLLEKIPISEIRPRVRKLVSLIFSINKFNYAPRSTE